MCNLVVQQVIEENEFLLTEPVFDQTEGHFRRATSIIEESVTPTRYERTKPMLVVASESGMERQNAK